MIIPISTVTNLISLGVIATQILIVAALIIAYIPGKFEKIKSLISTHALIILFIVSLGALLGSLFYSSIAGLIPCRLCWYQRILLFPQVIISAMAIYKKDRNAIDYILGLSILGAIIALYHYYIQFGGAELLTPCTIGGDCADKPFVSYGYITIPMMSLTAFLSIITVSVIAKKEMKKATS